jgi:hypothetical protein
MIVNHDTVVTPGHHRGLQRRISGGDEFLQVLVTVLRLGPIT